MRSASAIAASVAALLGACNDRVPSRLVYESDEISALADGAEARRLIRLGPNHTAMFAFSRTSKGNGLLSFPGASVRVYDSHGDGLVFEPPMLLCQLIDLNGDGLLDLQMNGLAVGSSESDNQEIFRTPVQIAFLYDPQPGVFRAPLTNPHVLVLPQLPSDQ